jgi:type III restriction enzyme
MRKTQNSLFGIQVQQEIIPAIQAKVSEWVEADYPGVSELTYELLKHWFGHLGVHALPDGYNFFKWHEHQRRAVETTIYLYEVLGLRRTEEYGEIAGKERAAQKAPWAKIGLQLATGSGKTKVMSLLMVWAHLHERLGTNANEKLGFGNTQLLLAPNLIVLERLLVDFADGKIFQQDPLIPPGLRREFKLQVVTPDSVPSEWRSDTSYLIVSNIHKLFDLGKTTETSLPSSAEDDGLSLFETPSPTKLDRGTSRIVDFISQAETPIIVFNDEAHHVHDELTHYKTVVNRKATSDEEEGIAWNRVLNNIQKHSGLSLQCDLSATLFEEDSRQWFRHTVYDFPLSEAIKKGIVKKPYIAKIRLQYKDGKKTEEVLDENIPLIDESAIHAFDRYSQLLQAGIAEWKKEQTAETERGSGKKILLFVVCNDRKEAKEIAERLEEWADTDTGEAIFAGKVIEIHIGKKELINEKDWQKIRDDISHVDNADSPYQIVVSVMMLKEGWDVRNIKVIVPLRPCDSKQLTEQLLGRGLRRMYPPQWNADGEKVGEDIREGLYVIRHPSFEKIIKDMKDIIEEEPDDDKRPAPTGVLVKMVEPEDERKKRDFPITRIVGAFESDDTWVERVGRNNMTPLAVKFPYVTTLQEMEGILKHESAGEVRDAEEEPLRYDIQRTNYVSVEEVIATYARVVRNDLHLSNNDIPAIKGIVKAYLERCTFDLRGIPLTLDAAVDFDEETQRIVIFNVCRPPIRQQVIHNVSKIIGAARSGKETADVEYSVQQAADLTEFEETVKGPVLQNPKKCVHTLCCFDSGDELNLAVLLEEAEDVVSWVWNSQRGVGFRIQYSFEGKISYYYPDFLVQLTDGSYHVIESKGSMRVRDQAKRKRAERYVELLRENTKQNWQFLFLLNDASTGRQDISWWHGQGRILFRDLVRYTENAYTESLDF